MVASLTEVIELINQADDPAGRKHPLPNDTLIQRYEQTTGITFPEEYKFFLKSVSNAFVGFMSPFVLNDNLHEMHGEFFTGLRVARKAGVPEHWIPICEDNGDYYCLTPDGSIRFWDHSGSSEETWPNLATWAKEAWLEGG